MPVRKIGVAFREKTTSEYADLVILSTFSHDTVNSKLAKGKKENM